MEETPLLANVDAETIALVEVRATYIYKDTDTDTCERVQDALRRPSPGDVELLKGALEELLVKHDMRCSQWQACDATAMRGGPSPSLRAFCPLDAAAP